MLKSFLLQKNADMPAWLRTQEHCPWDSREQFLKEFRSEKMSSLRKFLQATMPLQAQFEAERLQAALPKMLEATASENRDSVRRQFYRIAQDPRGLYILMDYVNFKTDGTLATARYKGNGWGLLQVLEAMKGTEPDNPRWLNFIARPWTRSNSASKILRRNATRRAGFRAGAID